MAFSLLLKPTKSSAEYIRIFIIILVYLLILYDLSDLYHNYNYKNNNLYTNIKKLSTIIVGCICLFYIIYYIALDGSKYNLLRILMPYIYGFYIGLHYYN